MFLFVPFSIGISLDSFSEIVRISSMTQFVCRQTQSKLIMSLRACFCILCGLKLAFKCSLHLNTNHHCYEFLYIFFVFFPHKGFLLYLKLFVFFVRSGKSLRKEERGKITNVQEKSAKVRGGKLISFALEIHVLYRWHRKFLGNR